MIDNGRKEFKRRMYVYVLRLIKFLTKVPDTTVVREIKSQLTRSGTSIGANYFEALSASSKKDFQNYFRHALKSANETRFWLALLRDGNLFNKDLIEEDALLLQETKELANIFGASLITMKGLRK